jgi:exodeoxyribonuclease V alpha subunit
VESISQMSASGMTAAWAEQKTAREIMIFLYAHGVGTPRAVRIDKSRD